MPLGAPLGLLICSPPSQSSLAVQSLLDLRVEERRHLRPSRLHLLSAERLRAVQLGVQDQMRPRRVERHYEAASLRKRGLPSFLHELASPVLDRRGSQRPESNVGLPCAPFGVKLGLLNHQGFALPLSSGPAHRVLRERLSSLEDPPPAGPPAPRPAQLRFRRPARRTAPARTTPLLLAANESC